MKYVLFLLLVLLPSCAEARPKGYTLVKQQTETACLPFDMPSQDAIMNSSKKVFAHYFNRFPVSIGNAPSATDYYATQYLLPSGEDNKWLSQGGYLRSRPLAVAPSDAQTYKVDNLKKEVRAAMARGINGFTFDVLSMSDLDQGDYLPNMLAASLAVDSRFKIMLMPDMTSLSGGAADVKTIVESVNTHPSIFRLDDGRVVVSPYNAELVSVVDWQAMISELAAEGINIAFVPLFASFTDQRVSDFAQISYGMSSWGTVTTTPRAGMVSRSTSLHALGLKYMAPVRSQDYRPKSYLFYEPSGSTTLRESWGGAIDGNADWVHIISWNDFSETSQIAPYIGASNEKGYAYYNMTGYYATWFLTGTQPTITRDVIYSFYRKEPYDAAAPNQGQALSTPTGTPLNIIELVGFLTSAGTLRINTASSSTQEDDTNGVHSFTAPLVAGNVTFSLLRNGTHIIDMAGDIKTVGSGGLSSGYTDMTYWGNSETSSGICSVSLQ